jgi:hypothetical protein
VYLLLVGAIGAPRDFSLFHATAVSIRTGGPWYPELPGYVGQNLNLPHTAALFLPFAWVSEPVAFWI